ncbi:hypothetical protein [Niabella ginsengisoli]|uniref:DUF1206 domain-containing protein n=1 Tax=Niabella ginsengisoli TaxID=522298 RepID=A0ABS9SMJ2_9BACT|nr:hypothetical protein [Niabella ginsengisoli]MCH5599587.1 hypothetical protein [Niabella ginsengisoli]
MMQEEEEKEQSIFNNSPSKEEAEALLQVSKWTRIISVIGFGLGAYVVVSMLLEGEQKLKAFAATMPGAVGFTYPVVVVGFFIIFFVAALVLYYLYKSSLLLLQGLQQKVMYSYPRPSFILEISLLPCLF